MHKREIALALAAIISTAAAFMFRHELNEERALTAQLRAATSAPLLAPNRTDSPAAVPVVPAAPSGASKPGAAALPESVSAVADRRPDWQVKQRQLLKDPRYVEALREQRRLTYRLRRDNAIRLFGVAPQTADALIELDIDGEIQMMALDPAASGEEVRKQYDTVQRDHDARVLALLGQDRFDRWQTYMETRGTRMQVDRFRSQLNGVDALRDDQVEPLITALAAEQKQMRTEVEEYRNSLSWDGDTTESSNRFHERQLEITRAANKRMLSSAGFILSTSQVKRLADMLDAELAQRATQDRMESLRQKIGPAPESGAGND
jgi:hypothetical protein